VEGTGMMEYRDLDTVPVRINPHHDGDLAFWARLLDASPDELCRAIDVAGSEIAAVRTFLAGRQLHLDFDGFAAGRAQ
jgi:hypothetical protein